MKAFALPEQSRLKVIKATPRKETHGKELVQAISLRLEWCPVENSALDLVQQGLQDMIFWTPPKVAAQCTLDGVPPVKKHIRCPSVARPWKVDGSLSGYTLMIEHGIDDSTALELYSCGIDKFEVDAKEGGSAVIRWSLASNKQITRELIGALCGLEGTEVVATLTAPTTTEGEAIDGTKGHPGAAAAGGDPDAGDLFADQHAGDFGRDDDAAGQGTGSSDDVGTLDDGDTGPVEGASDTASNDAAELEAGMAQAMAAAGLQPKAARRGRRIGGAE